MPVIAPFTEEELESMRGYDRKCSEKGDYRMDFIEKCIDDGARIAYRPDAAAKIRAMGMSLRAFAVQCGMGPSTVRSNMHREFCVTRASPLNTSFSGRRGEAVERISEPAAAAQRATENQPPGAFGTVRIANQCCATI